jgi:hypothetical protein
VPHWRPFFRLTSGSESSGRKGREKGFG